MSAIRWDLDQIDKFLMREFERRDRPQNISTSIRAEDSVGHTCWPVQDVMCTGSLPFMDILKSMHDELDDEPETASHLSRPAIYWARPSPADLIAW